MKKLIMVIMIAGLASNVMAASEKKGSKCDKQVDQLKRVVKGEIINSTKTAVDKNGLGAKK